VNQAENSKSVETESSLSAYQAKYYAHELLRSYSNDHVGKLAGLLFDAQVEPKPHQIDAAKKHFAAIGISSEDVNYDVSIPGDWRL
jgi:hypothetical protein